MTNSATIGALRIDLSMGTAAFEEGAKRAEGLADRFAKRIGVTAGAAAAAGNLIGKYLDQGFQLAVDKIGAAIDKIDNMGEAAQSVGLTVEQFSALDYVAQLTGSSINDVSSSLTILAGKLDDIGKGQSTAAAAAFKVLGINVKDAEGHLRSHLDVMLDVADRFAGMEDGAKKSALAVDIFGRSGAQLIPTLNEGRVGIERLTDQAIRAGVVVDGQTAQSFSDFKDKVDELTKKVDGLWVSLAKVVVPNFSAAISAFEKLGEKVGNVRDAIEELITTIAKLDGPDAVGVFDKVRTAAMGALGNLQGEAAAASVQTIGLVGSLFGLRSEFQNVTKAAFGLGTSQADLAEKTSLLAEETKKNTNTNTENANSNRNAAAAIRERITAEEAFLAALLAHQQAQDYNNSIAAIEQGQLAQLSESRYLTMEQFAQLNALYAEGAIGLGEYQDAMIGVGATMDSEIERAAGNIASNLKRIETFFKDTANRSGAQWLSLGDTIVDTLGMVFGESKAFAIAQAVINTAQAITNALANVPPPANFAVAAAIGAMGAAQIATIASTNKGGGGGGAAAAASASAGASAGAAASAQGPSQTLYVQGFNRSELFSGEVVSVLIEELLQRQRDGARIVLDR
ncbi:MAG: phage tail tape measure protein [Alphaproteobacteria bacterium]|nr:phage tail tape measure protein [Alphaproteobacteria bacterium]